MCLYIRTNQKENERDLKKWFGSRTKYAYVYKVLQKRKDENFYRSLNFSDFIWNFSKQKEFKVKRTSKPTEFELDPYDLDYGEIYRGFHIYTNLKVLKKERIYSDEAIVKFRVLKEDIVAVENGWDIRRRNFKELVCTRLEFVKVL